MPGLQYHSAEIATVELLGSLDFNLLRRFLGLKLLGKRQREYAFLEARFNFIRVDAFRQLEAALEGAKAALTHIIVLLLLLFFFLLLTFDDQVAIGDLHFEVFLIHPGQFGRKLITPSFGPETDIVKRYGDDVPAEV